MEYEFPEYRMIPLDKIRFDLVDDGGYQRTPMAHDVARMGTWRPELNGVFDVHQRGKSGPYFGTDCGHRHALASKTTPRPDAVPCLVHPSNRVVGQARKIEAKFYLERNVAKKMSPWHTFSAALCAQEEWATTLDRVYDETGFVAVSHKRSSRDWPDPVHIGAHGVMHNAVLVSGGEDAIRQALLALRETFGPDPDQTDEGLLYAYTRLFQTHDAVDVSELVGLYRRGGIYANAKAALHSIRPPYVGDGGAKRSNIAKNLAAKYDAAVKPQQKAA